MIHLTHHQSNVVPKFIKFLQTKNIILGNSHKIHHQLLNTNFAMTGLTNYLIGHNGKLGDWQFYFGKQFFYPFWLFMFLGGSSIVINKFQSSFEINIENKYRKKFG